MVYLQQLFEISEKQLKIFAKLILIYEVEDTENCKL
jgi:hypothetical protein